MSTLQILSAFVCTLGIAAALLLIWPRCPQCKRWGLAWPMALDDDDASASANLARCRGCGHVYDVVNAPWW